MDGFGIGDEGLAPLFHPALDPFRAGDIGEARRVVFEAQQAAAVEQLEFQLRQLRQVVRAQRAVVVDEMARDAANVALSDFALRAELKQTRPLSVLMAEQVDALREWARERTVPAD
jgi:hypothetical protein